MKRPYDFDELLRITKNVPYGLDREKEKEVISKEVRDEVTKRDDITCKICGYESPEYMNWKFNGGNLIHHIIPNGEASLENLITVCGPCHKVIHLILFRSGKWKYVPL